MLIGKPSAFRINNMNLFIDNRLAGFHGGAQTTAFLTDIRFQDILAQLADGFVSGNAS
ncbi:MAG: hypothetical protein MZU91_08815 [Desulfosudis oleivorans]|nr:hypothetical protein [Desulfosudis oleivorans]